MITMENYEGWLMRYADDALTAAERRQVEAFLADHPGLREEMEAVASVKVAPVVAVMPGKERLLRRDGAVMWHRVAAAVALLAVVGTAMLLLNRPEEQPQLAMASPQVPTAVQPQPAMPTAQHVSRPATPHPAPRTRRVAADTETLLVAEVEIESIESIEIIEPIESIESIKSIESTESPVPRATVTLGLVVEDARLAVNPWLEVLAYNH